jgi:hypothetical protein
VSCGIRLPGANEPFAEETITRAEVAVWYHGYSVATHRIKADSFNRGWGNTRFAPLRATATAPLGTCYAASTPRAAYLESILHDVSLEPPGVVDLDALRHWRLASIALPAKVRCVSLHTPFLPRLKLTRAQLIDSPAACYAETRAWAQAALDQRAGAQAIVYGSRRDDAARCIVLFQQRFRAANIVRVLADEPMDLPSRRAEFRALVRALKLDEI